jgi:hypothetical protein
MIAVQKPKRGGIIVYDITNIGIEDADVERKG